MTEQKQAQSPAEIARQAAANIVGELLAQKKERLAEIERQLSTAETEANTANQNRWNLRQEKQRLQQTIEEHRRLRKGIGGIRLKPFDPCSN